MLNELTHSDLVTIHSGHLNAAGERIGAVYALPTAAQVITEPPAETPDERSDALIKIYIANLGKYNEGALVGKWFSLPIEDIEEALESIGVAEDTVYEEYAIHDYESEIDGLKIGEYENLEDLNELAEELEALDEYERETLEAIIDVDTNNLREALAYFQNGDYTFYQNTTLEDLAAQFVDEGIFGDVSESLKGYINYEELGRDLHHDGYHETCGGVLHCG